MRHTQTYVAHLLGMVTPPRRVEPHGSGPVKGPKCGQACPQGGWTHLAFNTLLAISPWFRKQLLT